MVHGLQSTPVEFAGLVNALRADPVIRSRYQMWQFYYASGTPVLVSAAALRDSLVQTIHAVDPKDQDAGPKRIVVLKVPYHSVIGQQYRGPKERGSDGVVPYRSSHLDGAQSELIVRSGHGVFSNLDAVLETIRILHLEQRSSKRSTWRGSSSHRPIFSVVFPSQSHSLQPPRCAGPRRA
jgi:hypothetical protein